MLIAAIWPQRAVQLAPIGQMARARAGDYLGTTRHAASWTIGTWTR